MTDKEWIVPLEMTISTDCIVQAETSEEAVQKAKMADWIKEFRDIGEMVDWEVTGEPLPNE